MTNSSKNEPLFSKLYASTFVAVLALHAIAGWALVNIDAPDTHVKELKDTLPIEIELITPIIEKPPEVIELKPILTPEPKPEPKLQAVKKTEPIVKKDVPRSKPTVQKETPKAIVQTPEPEVVKKEPVVTQQTNQQPLSQKTENLQVKADRQRKILAAQAQVDALAIQQAKADAKAKAIAEAKRAQEIADASAIANAKAELEAQAKRDAEAKAQAALTAQALANTQKKAAEQAAQEQAAREQAAASNEPVSFTKNDASWRQEPSFSFPSSVNRTASSGDTFNVSLKLRVDKQGNVATATIASSSGNRIIDRAAMSAIKKAKFNPFTKNGVPVVGLLTLPVEYVVP